MTKHVWSLVTLSILLVAGCSKQDSLKMLSVVTVSGQVNINRGTDSKTLEIGTILNKGDQIVVGKDSRLSLQLSDKSTVILGSNSKVTLDGESKTEKDVNVEALTLNDGSVLILKEYNEPFVVTVSLANCIIHVSKSISLFSHNPSLQTSEVTSLSQGLSFNSNGNWKELGACSKNIIANNGVSVSQMISQSDILEMKALADDKNIDVAIDNAGCTVSSPVAQRLPPEWKKSPREGCSAGTVLVDTIEAVDPEGGIVFYRKADGPAGLVIDSVKGIITSKPLQAGQYKIQIQAIDKDSLISNLYYTLVVSKGLGVVINAPKNALINSNVTISVSPLGLNGANVKALYRFDCDNDHIFDSPDGEFNVASKIQYTYKKEGNFVIKVEIKDQNGQIASATRSITIRSRPTARLVLQPTMGVVGAEYVLDASGSSDSQDPTDSLLVRFDTDGDGEWNLPDGNGYLREKKVIWSWATPGKYAVTMEVTNSIGLTDTASGEILVNKGLVIDSLVFLDSVHVGEIVKMQCILNPEYPIVKYEWAFDKDSAYTVSGAVNKIERTFTVPGFFEIRCKVIDEKNQEAVIRKNIMIVNNGAEIDAGGPYSTKVNVPVIFKGIARDDDSKIVQYAWDFDADGKVDTVLKASAECVYTYKKAGTKKAYFLVTTDDNFEWKDSAMITVINKAPVAKAGDDIVTKKGRKVKLKGTGSDEDNNIVRYEWDFDADGKADWSSAENGLTVHEFEKYTNAIFKIVDADSSFGTDTIKVIICPEDMSTVEKAKFCIDTYEYPNKKGAVPTLNVTYEEAQKICADQGKHLCSAEEWVAACKNEEKDFNYPYGKRFEKDQCNTLANVYVKNKIAQSGELLKCAGQYEIFDMSGNAAEWVAGAKNTPYAFGGSWQNGEEGSKCDSKVLLQKGKKYFYVGFRCCK
jgi:PKD repeat protein